MFWRLTSRSPSSRVEALLEKEDFTLEELLDEEDIMKECKTLNSRLINFLRDRTQVEQLLRYIVAGPPEEADVNQDFKFPLIACEILTSGIDAIMNTLVEEEELMGLLFSFLEPNRSHSASSAGYFSKVVLCLMLRRTVPLMNYVQAHQNIFSQLVDLIGITSIMEVLIRIVEPDDHVYPDYTEVMQYLADNNLLDLIVEKLSPYSPPQVNANAAETLCAITRTAPSPLATKLSSPSFVARLFGHALRDTHSKSALVHSLSVLISLLDPRRSISSMIYSFRFQDNNESPVPVNPDTVRSMIPKLGDLVGILSVTDDARILRTTFGVLKPPLGKHRLKIVEFVAVLLKFGNDVAEEELVSSGAIKRILDLLFEYPYNNELHHHVASIIYSCLESKNDNVVNHLLGDCDLVGKILQANKHPTLSGDSNKPTVPSSFKKVPKAGYLGHLTRISNVIVQLGNSDWRISTHTQENSEWKDWVTDVLQERNDVEDVYNWDCGRPTELEDSMIDSDEEEATGEGEGDVDQDDKDVSYYDDGEVVIKSIKLDDDNGRSLFTNPNWFTFQDDMIDDIMRTSHLPNEMEEINVTSNRGSGCSDEVVFGKYELPEIPEATSSSDNISSGKKILEIEEDLKLQMEKNATFELGINPFSDQMDTAGTLPSNKSTGEIVPNDTSTSDSTSDSVTSEVHALPELDITKEIAVKEALELMKTASLGSSRRKWTKKE